MKPLIIGGHSLGAGRASILAGLACLTGRPPVALVNCGEPKPGFVKLAQIIGASGCAALSFCNGDADGHDLVTDVPFTLPGVPFTHTTALTRVSESPAADDPWDLFRYHHCPLYVEAVAKLPLDRLGPSDVTAQEVVELINGIYAYPGDAPVVWDHYDDGSDSDGVCWGMKRLPSADVVIFRGSTTQEDWIRDFDCVPTPWGDSQLGEVHPGFLLGMRQVWQEIATLLPWPDDSATKP